MISGLRDSNVLIVELRQVEAVVLVYAPHRFSLRIEGLTRSFSSLVSKRKYDNSTFARKKNEYELLAPSCRVYPYEVSNYCGGKNFSTRRMLLCNFNFYFYRQLSPSHAVNYIGQEILAATFCFSRCFIFGVLSMRRKIHRATMLSFGDGCVV